MAKTKKTKKVSDLSKWQDDQIKQGLKESKSGKFAKKSEIDKILGRKTTNKE